MTVGVEQGAAVIQVRDTGTGIDHALLESVFDPFTQAQQTLARSEGGLGLGLALVKGLVALHEGQVEARSQGPGLGAELIVKLPLSSEDVQRPRGGAGGALPPRPIVRRRVLVVDDNRDAAESLAQLVQMFGHDAEVAYDGPSAIRKACGNLPDVMLCDIGLPEMDGYAVAKEIRAQGGQGVRLIAVTGYAQPEDLAKAAAAGFDGHIAKPPAPEDIEQLLA